MARIVILSSITVKKYYLTKFSNPEILGLGAANHGIQNWQKQLGYRDLGMQSLCQTNAKMLLGQMKDRKKPKIFMYSVIYIY